MFQLTKDEYESIRFQIDTIEKSNSLELQNENFNRGRGQHNNYMPYAFTEQGIAMLSGVLNSDIAISMSIAIMRWKTCWTEKAAQRKWDEDFFFQQRLMKCQ